MSVVLSLGSNLGDRAARLEAGLGVLTTHAPVSAVSSVYETAPVGVTDQPAFLNLAAVLETGNDLAAAYRALEAAHDAEQSQDRVRNRRWGPRTLDVDVVAVGSLVSDDPTLTVPHPRAHERAFVLVPWLEVEPEACLVGHGRVADLLERLGRDGVVRVAPPPDLT